MTRMLARLMAVLATFTPFCTAANASYVGAETCQNCHREIATTQARTAMARTWGGEFAEALDDALEAHTAAGDNGPAYTLRRKQGRFQYETAVPGRARLDFPADVVVGGKRHGLGFLVQLNELGGIPLARPARIQARYFWSFAEAGLVLAPGISPQPATSYETAIGLVLTPDFETRCLTCHGQPHTLGAGNTGGVRCESCHGPGSQHLEAIRRGSHDLAILNPRNMTPEASIEVCAQCHMGFGRHIDPLPEDLLVANQVTALKRSECFIQSGQQISCITCHNPHHDAAADQASSRRACLTCHSSSATRHASICPVNATGNCIGCHMPSVNIGPLHLVDHWIRVHPEQGVKADNHESASRSQIEPLQEFLREIVSDDAATAKEIREQLQQGASFYDLALKRSKDPSSAIGGYLGDVKLANLDSKLAEAAVGLQYGEISSVVQTGQRWIILMRMPRDFRFQAAELERQADQLRRHGNPQASIGKSQEALKIEPHFLRAWINIGSTLAEAGAVDRAANVFRIASHLYPDDAQLLFDYALILGQEGNRPEAVRAYRRAIELEPDFVAAYVNLGRALLSQSDPSAAIRTFRQGLEIDPLSADLYLGLSAALARTGDSPGSSQAVKLAVQIDPAVSPERP